MKQKNYFCFSLKTGARIIGWFCILNSCAVLSTCLLLLRHLQEYINQLNGDSFGMDEDFTKGCKYK